MKLLRDIPTKHFVAIDIETVRIVEKYEDLSPEWKSAWEYKNKQSGEVPFFEELADSWEKTASLYAEFSKICAVSLVFMVSEEKIKYKEIKGEDEVAILTELRVYLQRMAENGKPKEGEFGVSGKEYRLVGHASKYFDFPFLCKRYIINSIQIPTLLDTAHLKPWDSRNICTNQDIWKMGGSGAGSSLQALCTVLQIPTSKNDLVGDEVGKAYYNGELQRIATYCTQDTIATFNVIRRIKGEKVFSFDEVLPVKELVQKVEEEEIVLKPTTPNKVLVKEEPKIIDTTEPEDLVFNKLPILHKILNASEMIEETKEELLSILKKKKPTKKDKVILEDILINLYINQEMFKSDKPELQATKRGEIIEILNKL
jgi:predicted PolB exonuclease-like 3'-5' exonuclease